MNINIRKATKEDVDGIVIIHQAAFKNFFLSSLGKRFLKLYYSTFIKSKDGVVYCAEKRNSIIGFSATSYKSKGFNANLIKKNIFKYSLETLRLVFTQPKSVLRLAKNLNKENNVATISDDGTYAELYSIAINPIYQGEGIGRSLLEVTEYDVRKHNKRISLTTDYYNNEKTIAFYHALGYKNYYEFIAYPERRMWRMIKELNY